MPINIQAPNNSLVSFPDGTDSGTINAVMAQHFGNQSTPQAAGMFDDLIPRRGGASAAGMFDDLIPHRGGASLAPSPSPAAQNLYHDTSAVPTADGSIVRKGEQPGVAADVAKSAGVGVGEGLIGLAGFPGNVKAMLPAAPAPQPAPEGLYGRLVSGLESARSALELPTSAGIQKSVENVTGPFYQPTTTLGKYAETAGGFLPAALTPTRGAAQVASQAAPAVIKLGERLLKLVAAPAVASETAGELTEGTAAEPFARAVGAVVAPSVMGLGRRAITPLPTSAERTAAVQTLRKEGVTDLTPGDITGRTPLRYFESEMGGTKAAASAPMLSAWQRALLNAALGVNRSSSEQPPDQFLPRQ